MSRRSSILKLSGSHFKFKGFTLVEILIVLGLMALILALSVYAIQNARFGKRLDEAAETVASNLERARNYSLAAKISSTGVPSVYGVYLADSYIVFHEGLGYDPATGDASATSYNLPGGITIKNGTLNAGDDIAFRRLTGESTKSGTIVLISPSGEERAIRVYSSGAIERAVPAAISGFSGRLKITFQSKARGVSEAVDRLPVLVKFTNANASALYASVGADYANKLRFVDANDYTYLPYEVDTWSAGGDSYVWVLVPKIDYSDTDFMYAYYGSPSRNVPENNTRDTWADYIGVWHASSTASVYDSSPARVQGSTVTGAVSSVSTGAVGNAFYIPSTGRYVSVNPKTPTGDFTIEAWTRWAVPPPVDNYDYPVFKKTNEGLGEAGNLGITVTRGFGSLFAKAHYPKTGGNVAAQHMGVSMANQWEYIVARHSVSSYLLNVFLNGVLAETSGWSFSASTGAMTVFPYPFRIGGGPKYPSSSGGSFDELRISEKTRTNAWIKASYESIKNPTSFTAIENAPL